MRSLRYYGPGSLLLEERAMPTVAAGEVLVSVDACGICATDLKTFVRGHPKIAPGGGLGHEVAGVVVAAPGANVWRAGQRVAVAPYVPCGTCALCRRGKFSLCPTLFDELLDPGGFSEFVRVPLRIASGGMVEVPASLSLDEACLAEPVACCLHAFSSLRFAPGDSVLIIGDGVMGLLQAEIARALGAGTIVISGMTPERLALASGVADVLVDARTMDVAGSVMAATSGAGADVVLVSVADLRAAELAVKLVRKGGAINLFAGMPGGSTLPLDMYRVHYDEVEVTGSFGFGPPDFRQAIDLMASGRVRAGRLVTAVVPLEGTVGALEKLARMDGVKSIVRCRAEGAHAS